MDTDAGAIIFGLLIGLVCGVAIGSCVEGPRSTLLGVTEGRCESTCVSLGYAEKAEWHAPECWCRGDQDRMIAVPPLQLKESKK